MVDGVVDDILVKLLPMVNIMRVKMMTSRVSYLAHNPKFQP